MEMPEVKPQSHTAKSKVEPRANKVTQGEVSTRKRSTGQKLGDLLFSEDRSTIKEKLFMSFLEASKDTFVQLVETGLEMLFYGGTSSNARKKTNYIGGKQTYTSYSSISKPATRRTDTTSRRSAFDFDDIIFNNREDAENVIDELLEILDRYHQVTVTDLYDACGITRSNPSDSDYGWIDLRSVRTVRERGGTWRIDLPRPIEVD